MSADLSLPSGLVTAMFTDIVESTRMKREMPGDTQAAKDAAYRHGVKKQHDERVLTLARNAGGRKVSSAGDSFLITFVDVDEAVLCAIAVRDSLAAAPIDTPLGALRLRIGIHTGIAHATDSDYVASAIDKAQRVQSAASPGEVLISEETHVHVKHSTRLEFEAVPDVPLKGFEQSTVYRVARRAADNAADAGAAPRSLADVENPYDFITTAKELTFKGRTPEAEDLLDSIRTKTHTAIFGLQRMGKTSLIEQGLESELQRHPALRDSLLLATIDMQRLGGAQVTYRDFAHAIFDGIIGKLAALGRGHKVQNLRTLTRQLFDAGEYQRGDRTEFFEVFARTIKAVTAESHRRIVLFIDEFSEIRNVIVRNETAQQRNPQRISKLLPQDMYIDVPFMHHLSSLLRDKELKAQLTFVVLVRPFMAEYDDRAGLQVLRLMKSITLGPLDHGAARELITEPLRDVLVFDEDAVEYLIHLTAGHPYLLQFILKLVVDKIQRTGRPRLALAAVKDIEERMVNDGPGYDAQFKVMTSDYSIDEVMHPKEARLGMGLLAFVSKDGQKSDGWVSERQIVEALSRHKIPVEKTSSLLSQLKRTRILTEECGDDEELRYRISIPLVQARFIRQNLYQKYFRST